MPRPNPRGTTIPTADQYRAARTLLGLTQHQVHEMTGMSTQAIKDIESIYSTHVPQRSYAQYYNCWLREFARMSKPELLGSIDQILDRAGFARMFRIYEPRPKKVHKTKVNETGVVFKSAADVARWLIANGYAFGNQPNVAQRVRDSATGRSSKYYAGFSYSYVDDMKEETEVDLDLL